MNTHPARKKAAPKRAAGKEATASAGSPADIDAGAAEQTPDWSDRNPALRRRYGVAEKHLLAAEKKGDERKARVYRREIEAIGREFFEINRGLVISQARRFNRNTSDDQDNLSAASLGLWEAFKRYDPDRGVAFSTFSRQHISGGVQREVRRNEFQHLSQSEFNLRKQVRLAQVQLAARLGRQPNLEELARHSGLALKKVEKILSPSTASLDAAVGEDGLTLGDRLESGLHELGDDATLEPFMEALSDLELWVLLQRGGFLSSGGISLVETADGIGIGREVARRAESRARVRIASTVLSERLGRLPVSEEVAALMGVDPDHVREYTGASWEDLRTRWSRVSRSVDDAVSVSERSIARGRLERIGEEFMRNASRTILEAAGRYLDEEGQPIGVALAAAEVWSTFLSWDHRANTFPAYCRERLTENFRRARTAVRQDDVSPDDLWSLTRDLRVGAGWIG